MPDYPKNVPTDPTSDVFINDNVATIVRILGIDIPATAPTEDGQVLAYDSISNTMIWVQNNDFLINEAGCVITTEDGLILRNL
jgi:hypothetical protein